MDSLECGIAGHVPYPGTTWPYYQAWVDLVSHGQTPVEWSLAT